MSGRSILLDHVKQVILSGEVALLSDGKGRSEIQIRDSESGRVEQLVFSTGTMWIPVYQLMLAIQDVHQRDEVEVVVPGHEVCPECGGHREYEDGEGNWRTCQICVP